MDLSFVSGWAGFPALFPDLPAETLFLTPFAGHSEADILAALAPGGDALLAWSTGAHLALKHRRALFPRFGRVVLAAPFLRFAHCVPDRVVRLMRRGLLADTAGVVRAFHEKCGVAPRPIPAGVTAEDLAAGLDFLLESEAGGRPDQEAAHVLLVRGADDALVPESAVRACLAALPGAECRTLPGGHFLAGAALLELLHG
jgi:pimeloyl-ACP methyl ester carboxylesterase